MTPRLVKPSKGGSPDTSLAMNKEGQGVLKFEDDAGGLHLTPDGLKVVGKPAFSTFENTMHFAVYMAEKSPWWQVDLIGYAKSRADWSEFIDQIIDAGTFTKGTIDQYAHLYKALPPKRRVDGVSFSHHQAVSSVEDATEQRTYLERAKREHLSVSELRQVVRKHRKVRKVLKGQASELAAAQNAITESAYVAAILCHEIPKADCKHAERVLVKVRQELEHTEALIGKLRKAQGKKP